MNWTELENITSDVGTEYEETIINWRRRRSKVQVRCPRCDEFFDLPKDMIIDKKGYCNTNVYHFCNDQFIDDDNSDGWVALLHLVGWEA